jgi:DNA-binding GntR family transcriptional regulator
MQNQRIFAKMIAEDGRHIRGKDNSRNVTDPAGDPGGKMTLSSHAYNLLREDILNAVLAPDKKLVPRELCQKYSIGPTPIREALNRLASEGMVVQSERRSFKVAGFSLVELDDILRTKIWLNEKGLRESIEHGDADWEERVLISFHRLSRTRRYHDDDNQGLSQNPDWNQKHLEFHESLISACRSEWLMGFCKTLFFASDRYRALTRLTPEASKRWEEHRMIAEAAIERNADRAVDLLRTHFTTTADQVRAKL